MAETKNPFHWRGTVTDPEAFIGRQRELTSMLARVQQLGCVSIVGERRIGKSSLAYQACQRAAKQLGPDCRPVYLDLLSARHHTLDGLLGAVLERFGRDPAKVKAGSPAASLAAFEEEVRALRKQGCLPVAFLDEFEAIGSRVKELGDDLLESWRSLANDGQMAFVSTSARPMDAITQESGLTSSFYNVFAQTALGELTDQEARAFANRAMRVGHLEMGDDVFLLRVGGQHPLRLQVAAWHLFEARQKGQVDFGLLQQLAENEVAGMMRKQ